MKKWEIPMRYYPVADKTYGRMIGKIEKAKSKKVKNKLG